MIKVVFPKWTLVWIPIAQKLDLPKIPATLTTQQLNAQLQLIYKMKIQVVVWLKIRVKKLQAIRRQILVMMVRRLTKTAEKMQNKVMMLNNKVIMLNHKVGMLNGKVKLLDHKVRLHSPILRKQMRLRTKLQLYRNQLRMNNIMQMVPILLKILITQKGTNLNKSWEVMETRMPWQKMNLGQNMQKDPWILVKKQLRLA